MKGYGCCTISNKRHRQRNAKIFWSYETNGGEDYCSTCCTDSYKTDEEQGGLHTNVEHILIPLRTTEGLDFAVLQARENERETHAINLSRELHLLTHLLHGAESFLGN